jgi:hypothetical protein
MAIPEDGRDNLQPRGPDVPLALPMPLVLADGRNVFAPLARVGDVEVIQSVTGGLVLRRPDGTIERCGMQGLDAVVAELTAQLPGHSERPAR